MKYVFFILDGSSDYPIDKLDNKTPLEVANTPNMDKITKKGCGGFTNNVPEGFTPGSDVANMSIFGFNPTLYYTGRGPLEAGSMKIKTTDTDVIFRCNTIFTENNLISDFNAGHITSNESKILLEDLNSYFNEKYTDFKGEFFPGISYRHIFVYHCDNLEEADELASLTTFPPHDFLNESIDIVDSIFLNNIMREASEFLSNHEINKKRINNNKLPANMVWLWGQGKTPHLPNFQEIYNLKGAVITGVDLLKGIGHFASLDIINVPGATGYFDTDYKAKGEYAIKALENSDVVFIHIEAPDEAGHAQNIEEKIKAIERIDEFIIGPVFNSIKDDFKIAILPDHPTPIDVGTHTRDDVPLIIYSSLENNIDDVQRFTEKEVEKGSILFEDGYKLLAFLRDEF